jgi:hypothetical protein
MVEAMPNIILWTIKVDIKKDQFIVVSCDEVITLDNQTW